jgi:hypothetical protein
VIFVILPVEKSVTPNESSSAIGTGQGATNATKPK